MHQKLDHPMDRCSAGAGLPDEKPSAHSTWAAAQLDELPTAGDGTLEIWDATSESWDTTLGTGNVGSETVSTGDASWHNSKMGL
jgi:hypothetical protein